MPEKSQRYLLAESPKGKMGCGDLAGIILIVLVASTYAQDLSMQDNKRPSNDIDSQQHDEKLTPAGAPPVAEHASDVKTSVVAAPMAPMSGGSDVTPGSIIIPRTQDPGPRPEPRPPYPAPRPTTTADSTSPRLHTIAKISTVETGVRADLTYHSASFLFNFISSTAYPHETKPKQNTQNSDVSFNEVKVTAFPTDNMGVPSKNDNASISPQESGKSTVSSTKEVQTSIFAEDQSMARKDVQTFMSTKELLFMLEGLDDTTTRASPAREIATDLPVNIPTMVSSDSETWNRALLSNNVTVKDSPLSGDVRTQITTSLTTRTSTVVRPTYVTSTKASTRITSETTESAINTDTISLFARDTFRAVTVNDVTVKPSLKEETAAAATLHNLITGQIFSFGKAITTTSATHKHENIKYFASTNMAVTTAFPQVNKSQSSSYTHVEHSLKPVLLPLCSCGCDHNRQLSTAAMPQHSQDWAMATKKLVVPKHQTAKVIRQKTSARDARTSSAMMGIFGIVSCLAVIFPIFIFDLLRLSHFLTRKHRLSGCSRHP